MSNDSFLPDDLPSPEFGNEDTFLKRQLEEATRRYFYESCDGVMQGLLLRSEWFLTTSGDALTLVIQCPDMITNWRVLNNIVLLGKKLEQFVSHAKIRICPPEGMGTPFEIRVDEISMYRDLL